jgi:hypothetical protein
LSPAEWRLLAITFIGCLGSIVVGACIIAGALALGGHQHGYLGQLA